MSAEVLRPIKCKTQEVYQTYNQFYKNADAHNGFIYTVHVRRSDYAKARKAVYGMA
ncbi:hypothetical protein [Proteiniclasticum sediminis]|uniref:hypothetical protein n=1 Tax=Proteiniclasticum sediminis TaxID=2804028 RepID=UPI001BA4A8EE|nr:hypothetical protein [Proteiniclasticum sediminis]